jgi:16S rRNA U516 pseudouridylate synthase RsuA-like enzyme
MRGRIGGLKLGDLAVGKWKILSAEERNLVAGE